MVTILITEAQICKQVGERFPLLLNLVLQLILQIWAD